MTALTRRSFLGHSAAVAALATLAKPLPCKGQGILNDLSKLPPISIQGDLAAAMVDGMHKFLDGELAAAPERRKALWKPDYSSVEAYTKSLEPKRQRLRQLIGAVDERIKPVTMEYIATGEPSRVSERVAIAKGDGYQVFAVRWPVFEGVDGEGLLLQPDKEPVARVIALPDADHENRSPESFSGLAGGTSAHARLARRLVDDGCQVLVPTLIDREDTWSGNPRLGRMTNQPHREFIYRMAYQMGRHIIGYEVQKVLGALDWLELQLPKVPSAVVGNGEGGLLAFLVGALDARVNATLVSGAFGVLNNQWEEPIYRNVWSLLKEVGDEQILELYVDRAIVIETTVYPVIDGPPQPQPGRSGAAPGRSSELPEETLLECVKRVTEIPVGAKWKRAINVTGRDDFELALQAFFAALKLQAKLRVSGDILKPHSQTSGPLRLKRQFDQLVNHTQRLMRQSEEVRQKFCWAKLNLKSLDDYQKSCVPLRKYFWEEVIGKLPAPTLPPNPRLRPLHDEPKWKSFEVTLDLYPDIFAYGILCVPKDLLASGGVQPRRPVVVCQHGLEGRPSDVVNPKEKTKYYNSFGSALADKGYVVFAPQNPYIFQNKFRQLQRKANPLGLSLFSFIVRQHERILDWLETLPFVDPKRLAFYGLSYGGKTAMRVPAILEKYCLSICSGDFNEWIWKNASVDFRGSYMFTNEYEMFEFDLGNTFNYAEMAALIAPRPFMVERGHDDGVGIDEWVAYEYAKVRRLYAKLGIPDRTTIEFFNGGHEINSKGTFEFLKRHLVWPV